MLDPLGIGEALGPDGPARLYGDGGMFPHGGGLAPFPGIGRGRVEGVPEERWRRSVNGVVDEDARPDRLMEALRANIAPRPGESFEQYNGRLNEARADVAAMVSDARRRGVKVAGNYLNNCISTVSANYNDRGMAGTNGRYYDPNGIYQSFSAEYNPHFADHPAEYGFKKVHSYRTNPRAAGVTDSDDKTSAFHKRSDYKRGLLRNYDFRRGDIFNIWKEKDNGKWYPFHAAQVNDRYSDGVVMSDYAAGSRDNDEYTKNNEYWLGRDNENHNDFFRYVGTPGEQRNRRLYYDEYRRREKEHAAMDESVRRHHANVERQLKSPEYWGVQIELPSYIWQK